MNIKLLTEHHLEFLSLKGGCTGSSESTLVKNATLLEITCHGSFLRGKLAINHALKYYRLKGMSLHALVHINFFHAFHLICMHMH